MLLNRTVDEGGNVVGDSVDLVLRLGHAQLCHQIIKNLDGLCILLLNVCGIHGLDGWHGDEEKRRFEEEGKRGEVF